MSGVAAKTGACTSLGGASGSGAHAHMGAGTTRTQPLLTLPEICPHPRFELSPLVKGSIGDPATNRPLGRWLCGSLLKDGETLKISTPSLVTKHMSNCTVTSQALIPYTAGANQAGPKDSKSSFPGNRIFFFPEMKKPKSKPKNVQDISKQLVQMSEHGCREAESEFLDFPSKILAMHRVRWNMNKGSERWLCYGGAAGIVRCQEIS